VATQAEAIANDGEQVFDQIEIGEEVRQGDVYVTRLAAVPPRATLVKKPQVQLAPGTTQGSRHCLRSLDGVKVYDVEAAGPLDGPVLECERGIAIDHPEHGNVVLAAGVYAVTYQRAFAEELRRVQD
jgi:hypothetical protein